MVEVVSDDAPFLVDSVSAALAAARLRHPPPVPPAARASPASAPRRTCTSRSTARPSPRCSTRSRDAIESVVDDVFAAVADWDALRAAVADFARGLRGRPRPTASRRRRRPRSRPTSTGSPTTTSRSWARSESTPTAPSVPGSELGVARRRPLFDLDRRRSRRRPDCSRSPRARAALHRAPRRAPRLGHRARAPRRRHRPVASCASSASTPPTSTATASSAIPVVRRKVA